MSESLGSLLPFLPKFWLLVGNSVGSRMVTLKPTQHRVSNHRTATATAFCVVAEPSVSWSPQGAESPNKLKPALSTKESDEFFILLGSLLIKLWLPC